MFPSKPTKPSIQNYLQKTEKSYKGTFLQKSAYQTWGDKVYKISSQNVKLYK